MTGGSAPINGTGARPRNDAFAGPLKGCLVIAILLVLIVSSAGGWLLFGKPATRVGAGKSVQLSIEKGASTRSIAQRLASAGVVSNPNAFRVRARLAGADSRLKPGVYDLTTGMSYSEALKTLITGPAIKYIQITVPEGFVLEQIAARVQKQVGIPAKQFLKLSNSASEFESDHPYLSAAYKNSLEGYLFPKTYSVRADASGREIIEMMLDQFDREMGQVDTTAARARGLDLNQLVVLASMIERETRLDEERPLVSSVVHNRLAAGRLLEIDATIEYVLPGNRFRLTYRDLALDSPYNTYMHTGLPPGPISNPGLRSLQAAANPAETDYVYYVLTGKNGSHTFTISKADFLRAKKRSKEVFGR